MPVVRFRGFFAAVGYISWWLNDGECFQTWSLESFSPVEWSGTWTGRMVYEVRARQNQCQVVRYLDERGHISKNVRQVHLVMTFISAGWSKFHESLV